MSGSLASVPEISFSWKHYNSIGGRRESGSYLASSVVHQAWNYRDETLGLLFVNLDGSLPASARFAVDPSRYGLKGDAYSVWRSTRKGREEVRNRDGQGPINLSVELPPRQIVLIEVMPRGHVSA
ncbi:MAG: hypothetical protein V3S41_06430 [Spirochaetia bacterium]